MSNSLRLHGLQYAKLPSPSPTPRAYSNSCPSSQWWHPTISSSIIPYSYHLQSFPATGHFPMSQFFPLRGQSIRVSASASVLSKTYWSLLGWTGWISLQFKGLSRVYFQHHSSKASVLWHWASFLVQPSHPYINTGKTIALTRCTFIGKVISLHFNMLSRLVNAFLPRSKCLLFSWLQSPSAVIFEAPKIMSVIVSIISIYLPWSDRTRCHDLSFLNDEF